MKTITEAANEIIEQLEAIGYTDEKPVLMIKGNTAEISWYAGPFEWTIDGYGLFDELRDYGMPGEYIERDLYIVPEGFMAKPITGRVLALFES